MQFQADILDRQVQRSQTPELSGLGAAFAAGLGCGFWSSTAEIKKVVASHDTFRPVLEQDKRNQLVKRWNAAVSVVKTYGLAQ
jgi:glycerol kinase